MGFLSMQKIDIVITRKKNCFITYWISRNEITKNVEFIYKNR